MLAMGTGEHAQRWGSTAECLGNLRRRTGDSRWARIGDWQRDQAAAWARQSNLSMGGVEGSGSRDTQGKSSGGATSRSQDIATADGCVGEDEVAVKAKAGGNWVGACAAAAAWWPLGPHASDELHFTLPQHTDYHTTHSALRPSAGPPRHWARARAVECTRVLLPPASPRASHSP
ncbi:uncharacterized protein CC84DRAFT_1170330 [Paraphaeosphaeria sporulosa]|uniref:Uncharacterized protein n=1 Tax=Paraphaeosphaeria sporulosa TaxID=1460663 RepID=A0A177CWK1_9PLEO|nr:uncharacterized protein CC84DRAFT_1170330 [Paraphaeosphaeria sporulosa]OAG11418.1 hypothetical protein CC84DRAFT_1170330 [Paraphaeosphaeria sporulosa]